MARTGKVRNPPKKRAQKVTPTAPVGKGVVTPVTPVGDKDRFAEISQETPRTRKMWTPAKEQELCDLWQDEAHLYDATAKDYRNTNKRTQALKRMATILEIDRK